MAQIERREATEVISDPWYFHPAFCILLLAVALSITIFLFNVFSLSMALIQPEPFGYFGVYLGGCAFAAFVSEYIE